MARILRPETARVPLSDGDWLIVKKRLTAGETREMYRGGITSTGRIDHLNMPYSRALAYLVDWSVTDPDGKPVIIRDKSRDEVASALDALDPDFYGEIMRAIEAHEDAMRDERDREKKAASGQTDSGSSSGSASA